MFLLEEFVLEAFPLEVLPLEDAVVLLVLSPESVRRWRVGLSGSVFDGELEEVEGSVLEAGVVVVVEELEVDSPDDFGSPPLKRGLSGS